jgi:BlaI family transcriptional regulator, penicillinase repressor
MSDRSYELGTAELEVLRVLWDLGTATVREVLAQLQPRGRNVAYTTVQTFLTRLEQKGYVTADKKGLAFVYRPRVSREKISRSRLKSLLNELYDGAAGPLVLHLVSNEKLTPAEMDQLQKLIERLDRDRS